MDYDMIQIQIEAEAQKANSSVDALVNKLNKLSNSLTSVGGAPMYNLASGVDRLGVSMQKVSAVETREFTRLSNNIKKISGINAGEIIYSATAINSLGESLSNLGGASANAQSIGEVAGNISKLGNKGVQNAVTNIPLLATALNELMVVLAKSPAVNQNLIDMTNALANLASQGSKVGTASNTLVNGMNRTSTAMQRTRTNTFSLASAFGKFYASYFLVIRGIKGLWTSIESTADYIEAFNYFNVAFGKVSSEWGQDWEKYGRDNAQAYADSFTERINETLGKLSGINVKVSADGEGLLTSTNMKNLGLNIQEVTQYASQLASITNSVGQTGETTLAVSDAFVKLAGDISSLFNVDYESVAKNLQSGLIGQSRALYKYGVDITNATLQTYAYAMGIEKSVSEMTQAEKMQLRYIAILDQSKVAFGDLANTINSPSNMIRQLSTNLKEAGMVLGQLFIPFLEKTLPKLNGFSIAIKNVLVDIAGILGIEIDFSEFGQGYDESQDNIDGVTDSLEDVEDAAKKANKAIRSFDELLVIGSSSAIGSDAAQSTLDLTKEILDASAEYNRVWNKAFEEMENKAQAFAKNTEKYFEPIKNIIADISRGDWFEVGEGVSELANAILETITTSISNVDWVEVGEGIGDFLEGIDWEKLLFNVGKLFWSSLNASVDLWKKSFDTAPIETAIVTAVAAMSFKSLKVPLFKSALTNAIAQSVASGISLQAIVVSFASITLATPVGVYVGEKILTQVEDWIEEKFGKVTLDAMGASLGIALPTVIGTAFGGPIGALVGGLIGLIIDAFAYPEYSAKIWNAAFEPFFNFSDTKTFFARAKANFEKAIDSESFWEIGKYIAMGVLDGIGMLLTFPLEPFVDFFNWVVDAFCNVFGIHSPAEEMNFIGEYIVLGIADGFVDGFTTLKEKIKELWNSLADWLNQKMSFEIDPIKIMGKTVFDGAEINLGFIPKFEVGGFPEDGLFFANHSELVGKFSNGKTAVANNAQIIQGIEDASYRGMARAIQSMMKPETNDNDTKIVIQIDGKEVFDVVQKRANNYFNANGVSAFSY